MSEMDEIWNEIDSIYILPERQPDDIDSRQLAKRYEVSETAALRRMHLLADSGKFTLITVKDITRPNGKCLIIRKK